MIFPFWFVVYILAVELLSSFTVNLSKLTDSSFNFQLHNISSCISNFLFLSICCYFFSSNFGDLNLNCFVYVTNKETWTLTENCKLHFPQTHIDKTVFSVQPTDQNQKDMHCITITKWKAADLRVWKTRTRKCFDLFAAYKITVMIGWWLGSHWWNHCFISLQNRSLTTLSLTFICDFLHTPT